MSETSETTFRLKTSVVVPVYNEVENIEPLLAEVDALGNAGLDLEIVVVDDGSSDGTWEELAQCKSRFQRMRAIRHKTNRGQSAALLTGIRNANGDVIVTMDGDMQNNPADIPRLIEALRDCDVVCGYRLRRKDTWSRKLASRLANAVRNMVTHDGIRDTGCSLKAFRRICIDDIPAVDGMHRFMPAYFVLAGRRVREIAVDHRPRTRGRSKYTNLGRLPRTIWDLIGFAWYRSRRIGPIATEKL